MTRSTSPPTPRSPPSPVAAIAAVVTGVAASTENATMLPTLLTTTMVPIDTLSTDHNAAFMSSRTPSPPLSPPLLGEGGNVQVTSVGFSPLATSVDDQTSIIDDADERMQGLAALAQQQENADSMTNKPSSFGVTYVDGMPVTTYQQHVQRLSDDGSDDDEDDYVQDDATTVRAFAAMSTGRQNDKDSTSAAILSYLQKTGGRDSAGESAAEMATPTTMTTSVADPVDTSHSIWNANKLFQIGFRYAQVCIYECMSNDIVTRDPSNISRISMSAASYSSLDDGDDMQAILDDDARRLLASRDGVAADERMVVARTKDLLRRFLELERPKLTEQMLEFLLMDGGTCVGVLGTCLLLFWPCVCRMYVTGVFDVLMNFITRLPWTADSESMHTLDWSLDQADNTVATLLTARDKHVRECHDIDVQKNAYQAVEVLCGTSPSNVRLLDMKQREIGRRVSVKCRGYH